MALRHAAGVVLTVLTVLFTIPARTRDAARIAAALKHAKAASGLRVIGPNTVGIPNSHSRAYATFSSAAECCCWWHAGKQRPY